MRRPWRLRRQRRYPVGAVSASRTIWHGTQMARLGGPSLRWPLPLREPVVPRGRLFRSNRAKCFRGRLMRRILALATFAALSACGVDSRPSEVGQLRLQQSTLVVATATAASDPFQEAISACFDRAYAERSILAPFRGPAEGQYEVTCGKGNVVNREEKANIFEFVLPINYTLEEATFVPLLNSEWMPGRIRLSLSEP